MGWSSSSLLTMQFNSPRYNDSRPPIDNNFCYMYGNSEVMQPLSPIDGSRLSNTTNEATSYPFTTQGTTKANIVSATNSSANSTRTATCSAHNARLHVLSTYILDDDMLSLDISDEEIGSFMEDAMQQDDVLSASSDNVDHKSHPLQGESVDIDTMVKRQEAILITTMQKSAQSRAAVQRLGILSTERLNYARKNLQRVESPNLSSATYLAVRNYTPQVIYDNKDDTMTNDSIIAAARMALVDS